MSQSAVEQHEPQGEICSPQAAESRAAEENTTKNIEPATSPRRFSCGQQVSTRNWAKATGGTEYVFLLLMLQSL